MIKLFKRKRGSRPRPDNSERPWINRLMPDEDTLKMLAEPKNVFQLSLADNDDDEKPWITRLVAEKFFYELNKGQYEQAWKMLDHSKQKTLASNTIKEKWENYTQVKGGLTQRIGSKLIGQNNGGTVVQITFKADAPSQTEVDIFVTIINTGDEGYRIFECTPVE